MGTYPSGNDGKIGREKFLTKLGQLRKTCSRAHIFTALRPLPLLQRNLSGREYVELRGGKFTYSVQEKVLHPHMRIE
jgi:hypothetical protein